LNESELTLRAFAKLNLYLEILGRRVDGYHDIRSLMVTVDLSDLIVLRKAASGVTLRTDSREVPADEENLCTRAALALRRHTGTDYGAEIRLVKSIPVAAGLGGGSSDAACTLAGLNKLWNLGLAEAELARLASDIGSDVPFFLRGGLQLAEGRGEALTPLEGLPDVCFVLASPQDKVSSAWAYSVAKIRLTSARHVTRMRLLSTNLDADGVVGILHNDLETGVEESHPVIRELKAALVSHGAVGSLMSGSGPAVFGVTRDRASASKIASRIHRSGLSAFAVSPVRTGWVELGQQ
jgi:4-diphosphocytidyl-2-C-methyl-D-erythritol kinase